MGEPNRVVFLDIDGPMIPATMALIDPGASWKRMFPVTTIAVVNALCERSGAKIVLNTTHNIPIDIAPDIEIALVNQGLDATHLHPTDLKTRYPDLPRGVAVREWLARHPEVERWVALDDAKFTEEPNLIWIDPDAGLHVGHLNQAIEMLGGEPFLVLM